MLNFVLEYRKPVDTVTADKRLKLRQFELEEDDWKIVSDLVSVLGVCSSSLGVWSQRNACIPEI